MSLDRGDDLARIALAARLEQRDARARHRPPHQLPHRDVERHRRLLQNHVSGTKRIPPLHPVQPVDHRPVLDHYSLGPPGRSRRVYDVSQVLGGCERLDRIGPGYARFDTINTELISHCGEFCSGHDDPGTAVFDDRADTYRRIPRIDRHVRGASAQDSMDRDDQLRRARHDHPDALVTLDPPGAQHFRDVIHGGVELLVTERSALRQHRRPLAGRVGGHAVNPHVLRDIDIKHQSVPPRRTYPARRDPRPTACRCRRVTSRALLLLALIKANT